MEVYLTQSKQELQSMELTAAKAALICQDNIDLLFHGVKTPSEILICISNRGGCDSVLELINLTFNVEFLSRACLQEFTQQVHVILRVGNRRDVVEQFKKLDVIHYDPSGLEADLEAIISRYEHDIFDYIEKHPDTQNNHLEYAIPGRICIDLFMTVNIRELRHITILENAPQASEEFRELCSKIIDAVPKQFRYLLFL